MSPNNPSQVPAASEAPSEADIQGQNVAELVEKKILHALEIFPFLSSSMIHMALGTSTPTILWRPILERLVREGAVHETNYSMRNPVERQQSYTIYHLAKNDYLSFISPDV